MGWAIVIIIGILGVMVKTASRCFDDEDPDMYWHDNFAPPSKGTEALEGCTHPEKTDIVVNVACTCEEIYTLCDVCDEVLDKRTEC